MRFYRSRPKNGLGPLGSGEADVGEVSSWQALYLEECSSHRVTVVEVSLGNWDQMGWYLYQNVPDTACEGMLFLGLDEAPDGHTLPLHGWDDPSISAVSWQ